jgi:hypothetical protein
MAAFLNVCRFNPTAGGTTDWTYSSAVTGYQSPSAAGVVNGRLYKYRAESSDLSQWELGEGAYNTGTGVLARTTVLYNSSGTTSKINFSAAPQVAIVALKEDLISVEESNSFSTTQKAQARTNIGAAVAPVTYSSALGADVTMTTQNTAYNAVSVAQGTSGTFLVIGRALVVDPTGAAAIFARLSDGLTIWATSGPVNTSAASARLELVLSVIVTNPAGDLRIQCINTTRNGGTILWNASGQNVGDTRIDVIKIA